MGVAGPLLSVLLLLLLDVDDADPDGTDEAFTILAGVLGNDDLLYF